MITSGFLFGVNAWKKSEWFIESSESPTEKAGIPLDFSNETLEEVGEKRRMASCHILRHMRYRWAYLKSQGRKWSQIVIVDYRKSDKLART